MYAQMHRCASMCYMRAHYLCLVDSAERFCAGTARYALAVISLVKCICMNINLDGIWAI